MPSIVSVADASFASGSNVHRPVSASYDPELTVPFAAVAVRPVGSKSVKLTPVASAGPLFVTSISNVTVSPSFGVTEADDSVLTVTRSVSPLRTVISTVAVAQFVVPSSQMS